MSAGNGTDSVTTGRTFNPSAQSSINQAGPRDRLLCLNNNQKGKIIMEKITLYYRQDNSDKIYQASIEPKDDGYVVTFAYGRRGATLQTGTKTTAPVNYNTAKAIYDKLVREKTGKGYTPGEDGSSYQHNDRQSSGIHPQLLNAIDEDVLELLLNDRRHVMQEKHDGRRLLIQKQGDAVTGINKLGLMTGFPTGIAIEFRSAEVDFLIDGEIVGEDYHVFDLLDLNGDDLRERTYQERYFHLINLLSLFNSSHIRLVESASLPAKKRALLTRLKVENREGCVFKDCLATYTAGRPNSGGPQLKFKFNATASCIVIQINAKRSVGLMLFNGEKVVPVGNVTIPPNYEIPRLGAVVEVRYLYAFRGGSLFQPVYLGDRDDIRPEECQLNQLKFKENEPLAIAC